MVYVTTQVYYIMPGFGIQDSVVSLRQGYFRLLPYPLIRAINRREQPAVFYLHPYELDTEELRRPLPGEGWKTRRVRFSQGLGRGKVEGKLRRLLADFEWGSVREWMADKG